MEEKICVICGKVLDEAEQSLGYCIECEESIDELSDGKGDEDE